MPAGMMAGAEQLPPWLVGAYVRQHGADMGASWVEILLQDFDQRGLVALDETGPVMASTQPIPGSLEGEAFSAMRTVEWADGHRRCLALPMMTSGERVGVLRVDVPADDGELDRWEEFAAQAAALIVSKGTGTDLFFQVRRRKRMTLAAEMQWHLLPPLSIVGPRFAIAGMVEPAYEMGGDAVDYAINHGTAHLAVFDAMGHALEAAIMATVAVSAYRHARRLTRPLPGTYRLMDTAFAGQFGPDRYVTAVLAEVDLENGVLSMVNAGHPPPLHVRGHRVLGSIDGGNTLPVGLAGPDPQPIRVNLEPGDRIVLYSDGVTEARHDGHVYGLERLVGDVEAIMGLDLQPPEAARQLSRRFAEWRRGDPDDDATLVIAEWRGPDVTLS